MSRDRIFGHDAVSGGSVEYTVRPFRYHLVDVAGREVDVVDRPQPLQVDERITVNAVEAWRVVAVLGLSATVSHD